MPDPIKKYRSQNDREKDTILYTAILCNSYPGCCGGQYSACYNNVATRSVELIDNLSIKQECTKLYRYIILQNNCLKHVI